MLLNMVAAGKDTVKKFHTDSFLMCSKRFSALYTDFMEDFRGR